MIGQTLCIAGFLALAAACLSGTQYSFNRKWGVIGMGLAIIGALFVVFAFMTLEVLCEQVWS